MPRKVGICPRCKQETELYSSGWCAECQRAYDREWRAKNRDRYLEHQRERYRQNPEHELALRKKYRDRVKRDAIAAYGGQCACCGEAHWEFLAIDHINGGGKQHRKEVGAVGKAFYAWLRRNGYPQDDFQVLCHNCNQSFGLYGYCPHGTLPPRACDAGIHLGSTRVEALEDEVSSS